MPKAQLIEGVGHMKQQSIEAKSTDLESDCRFETLGKLLNLSKHHLAQL